MRISDWSSDVCSSDLFSKLTSPKVDFLKAIAKGAFLIEDEAHNAAGASNVSSVIDEVENVTRYCLYSSATFAAKPENMKRSEERRVGKEVVSPCRSRW